jgi:phospholipid-binding lipoprotein MlaA
MARLRALAATLAVIWLGPAIACPDASAAPKLQNAEHQNEKRHTEKRLNGRLPDAGCLAQAKPLAPSEIDNAGAEKAGADTARGGAGESKANKTRTAQTDSDQAELAQADSDQADTAQAVTAEAARQDAGPAPNPANELTDTPDPFEPLNRRMFALHLRLDRALIAPAARSFRELPDPVRLSLTRAANNIQQPLTVINSLLQGDGANAGRATGRFLVNSTFGVAGLFDIARRFDLNSRDEDFGQTLAVWGAGAGPYLFVPGMGPSTLRDQTGRVVNTGLDPLNYAGVSGEVAAAIALTLRVLDVRADALEAAEELDATAPDLYLAVRRLYAAARDDAVRNGQVDIDNLPQFEDIPPDLQAPPDLAP